MGTTYDIAFAGAGRMGVPMISRLLEAGHRVRWFDPAPAAGAGLGALGAERVAAPEQLASSDVSISLVPDGAALAALLHGDQGIASAARAGHLHLSMSTVGPRAIVEVAARAPELVVVDAPVSGSVGLARDGELTAIVGAAPAEYDRALPLLRDLTRRQFRVGEVGAGSALKLAVNAVVAATNQAVAEALVLAGAHGITHAAAYEVLLESVVASPFLGYKREAFMEPRGPVAGSVSMLRKDVGLALAAAAEAGVALPATRVVHAVLGAAAGHGLADLDVAAVLLWVADLQDDPALADALARSAA